MELLVIYGISSIICLIGGFSGIIGGFLYIGIKRYKNKVKTTEEDFGGKLVIIGLVFMVIGAVVSFLAQVEAGVSPII